MWNMRESWIVQRQSSQELGVTFPPAIRLACLGFGDAVIPDLTAAEVARIEMIARELHYRSGWESPPDPAVLAHHAGVTLFPLPAGCALPEAFGEVESLYRSQPRPRNDGLAAAYALAASLVLKRGIPWSHVFCWRLAAELLAPAWAIDARGMDHLAAEHPHAPPWLVTQRQTQRLAAAV